MLGMWRIAASIFELVLLYRIAMDISSGFCQTRVRRGFSFIDRRYAAI